MRSTSAMPVDITSPTGFSRSLKAEPKRSASSDSINSAFENASFNSDALCTLARRLLSKIYHKFSKTSLRLPGLLLSRHDFDYWTPVEVRSRDQAKISRLSRKSHPTSNSTLPGLQKAAADCKACDLWENATQTVFGEGKRSAKVLFIGEQPGNDEDLQGRPFVGPAGRLLDQALEEAGIDRRQTYVTNVVKHFKWEPRGKRRIHKKPNSIEIQACRPWLEAEIATVKPRVIVCLGATAAQTLLGKEFRVSRQRGQPIPSPLAPLVIATVHPSSILRASDEQSRHLEMQHFIDDLKIVADALSEDM